jgi:hypothetical protein
MTEILEWALEEGARVQAEVEKQDGSSSGDNAKSGAPAKKSGLLGLFGLGGKGQEQAQAMPEDPSGGYNSSGSSNSNSSSIGPVGAGVVCASQRELLRLRVTLCPHKLRLAHVLADFGSLRQAYFYACQVKDVCRGLGLTAIEISNGNNGNNGRGKTKGAPPTMVGGPVKGPGKENNQGQQKTLLEQAAEECMNWGIDQAFLLSLDQFLARMAVALKAQDSQFWQEHATKPQAVVGEGGQQRSGSLWGSLAGKSKSKI